MTKGWMMTYTGLMIDPFEPDPRSINITDIAHHLALTNRYGGATRSPYSVAEHSVHVCYNVTEKHALEALLHDASEYVMGDVISPIKESLSADHYRHLEERWKDAIFERFRVVSTLESKAEVKLIDTRIMLDETSKLMSRPEQYALAKPHLKPLQIEIGPWEWEYAKQRFLRRFQRLAM